MPKKLQLFLQTLGSILYFETQKVNQFLTSKHCNFQKVTILMPKSWAVVWYLQRVQKSCNFFGNKLNSFWPEKLTIIFAKPFGRIATISSWDETVHRNPSGILGISQNFNGKSRFKNVVSIRGTLGEWFFSGKGDLKEHGFVKGTYRSPKVFL